MGIAVDRPSGYSAFIKLVTAPLHDLVTLVTVQHLLGVVTAVLRYAVFESRGVSRRWSLPVSAMLLSDAYAVALEQHVMPEAVFTLLVVTSMFLVVMSPRTVAALAASGCFLGVAATVRTAALFTVPVWAGALLMSGGCLGAVRRRVIAAGTAGLAALLSLVLYGVAERVTGHPVTLNASSGWFLYGCVAEIADCRSRDVPSEERALCESADRPARGAIGYIWSSQSPAVRQFGPLGGPRHEAANRVLGRFARATIKAQTGDYAAIVIADLRRMFTPRSRSVGNSDAALSFRRTPHMTPRGLHRWFGTGAERQGRLAPAVRAYARTVHTPRWLLGLTAILGVLIPVLRLVAGMRSLSGTQGKAASSCGRGS